MVILLTKRSRSSCSRNKFRAKFRRSYKKKETSLWSIFNCYMHRRKKKKQKSYLTLSLIKSVKSSLLVFVLVVDGIFFDCKHSSLFVREGFDWAIVRWICSSRPNDIRRSVFIFRLFYLFWFNQNYSTIVPWKFNISNSKLISFYAHDERKRIIIKKTKSSRGKKKLCSSYAHQEYSTRPGFFLLLLLFSFISLSRASVVVKTTVKFRWIED